MPMKATTYQKTRHNGDVNDNDYYNNNRTLTANFSNNFVHTVHVEITIILALLCSCRGSSSAVVVVLSSSSSSFSSSLVVLELD